MLSEELSHELQGIRKLTILLRDYRWLLPMVILLGLMGSALEGVGITLFIPLFGSFGSNHTFTVAHLGHFERVVSAINRLPGNFQFLVTVGLIVLAVALKNIVNYSNFALFSWAEARVGHKTRVTCFDKILSMSLAQTENENCGRLISLLETETWRMTQAMSALFSAITSACTAVVFVALLVILSWRLTLLVLVIVFMVVFCFSLITARVSSLGRQTVSANTSLAKRIWLVLSGMRVVHSFGREAYELKEFSAESASVRDLSQKLSLLSGLNGYLSEILITAIIGGLALFMRGRQMNVALIAVFILILYRMQPRLRDLLSAHIALQGYQGAVDAVTGLMFSTGSKATSHVGAIKPSFRDAIRFESVVFQYPNREIPAVHDVSVEIRAGTTVAVVGASGAGKSTVLDLLCGFRQAQEGRITVDGIPVQDLDLEAWRSQIGFVSQDAYIFDDTIQSNILYGRLDAAESEIHEAARLALATGFISNLPQGFHTTIGERGVRLSGGQKQRLVLARALVRNPSLLLLDEATNALDSITEDALQQVLSHFKGHRTVIVVAHRLSTVMQADEILVFDGGTIVERGTFSTLLAKEGLFAQMYQLQNCPMRNDEMGEPHNDECEPTNASAADSITFPIWPRGSA